MDEYIEEKISLVQFIQHLQLRIHFLETVIELKNDALLRNAQDLKLVIYYHIFNLIVQY